MLTLARVVKSGVVLTLAWLMAGGVGAEEPNKTPLPPPCTAIHPVSKLEYDLRPLIHENGDDWKVDGLDSGATYLINMCRDILDKKSTGLPEGTNVGAFQKTGDLKGRIIGKVNRVPFFRGDRLMLQYSDGDDCPGSTLHKKTTLFSFECDQSKPKTNPPEFVAEMNNCTYWFQWKTPIACPTKIVDNVGGGGGGGGESSNVAKWIIIVGLIYFLGGILLKRFLYNAYGIEQIPHYTFWRGIIIFLRDGILSVLSRFSSPRPSTGRHYGRLNDEEQAFIDDDDHEGGIQLQ